MTKKLGDFAMSLTKGDEQRQNDKVLSKHSLHILADTSTQMTKQNPISFGPDMTTNDNVRIARASKRHRGSCRCSFQGCTKVDKGGGFCISHGGGKRYRHEGSTKGSVGQGLSSRHGGGKRCEHHGCTKGAAGSEPFCCAHGRGRRCKKLSQERGLCKTHGGRSNEPSTPSPQSD